MPKPAHLTWEEAAVNALTQLHELPHAREPERRADDAGPDRARSGARAAASARTRASTCSTAAARRSGWCRARSGPSCCTRWASSTSSTARPRATSSGRTSTPRTRASGAGSARSIRELVGHRPRHRVRAPRPLDDGRVGVRVHARRHDHHLRGDHRLHDRVRQPLPLDEPEDAQGLPLRQLPRGVGGQPAHRARARSTRCCRRCSRSRRPARRSTQVHHNLHEGKLGVLCSRPRRASASTDPELARAARSTRSRCSAVITAERRSPSS